MTKKKKEKLIFWSRFSIYVLFGFVAPVVFLAIRFELFKTISKVSIGGWELIIFLLAFIFIITLIKYVKKGLPYSLFTQFLNGLTKVIIPLLIVLLVVNAFKNSADKLEALSQFMVFLIACEIVAVVANPFPKWIHDNHLEDQENQFRKIFEGLGIIKQKQ